MHAYHLHLGAQVNDARIPNYLRIPCHTSSLNGFRLLLLETVIALSVART
jgi:hypothetical protein